MIGQPKERSCTVRKFFVDMFKYSVVSQHNSGKQEQCLRICGKISLLIVVVQRENHKAFVKMNLLRVVCQQTLEKASPPSILEGIRRKHYPTKRAADINRFSWRTNKTREYCLTFLVISMAR